MTTLRIRAVSPKGFWRCGVFHPATPVNHPPKRFPAEVVARLQAESNLVVEEIDAPEPGGEKEAAPRRK